MVAAVAALYIVFVIHANRIEFIIRNAATATINCTGNFIFPVPKPGGVRYDRARRIGDRG
jgi:hypothetical protein